MTVLFSSLRARFYSTVRNEAIPVSNIRLTLLVDVSINTQGDYSDRQEATHLALYRRYIRIPYARFSNFFSLLSKTFKRTLDQIFFYFFPPLCVVITVILVEVSNKITRNLLMTFFFPSSSLILL